MVPCLVVSSDLFGQLELVNCSPIHRRRMREKLKPRFDIGNLTFMYIPTCTSKCERTLFCVY